MQYTFEQVKRIYAEMHRRIYNLIRFDSFVDDNDRREFQNAMLQGIYSALMATASNWPDVVQWCSRLESDIYCREV